MRGGLRVALLPELLILLFAASCHEEASPPSQALDAPDMLQAITRPVAGGAVHQVRMTQRGDQYAFEPAEITIVAGDVVRFVMVGNQPESVVFDTVGLSQAQAEYLVQKGLDRGVLLIEPGAAIDAGFDGAPSGEYPFRSIPHHASGMVGKVHVVGSSIRE